MELRAVSDLARIKASMIVGLVIIFGMIIESIDPIIELQINLVFE